MSSKKHPLNYFFDKIFVINLFDKEYRWKKVNKQFQRRGIKADRFIAVDGRCKDQGDSGCEAKLKSFEISYNIKIKNKYGYPLKELLPASSLTIGTLLLLRAQVKNNWKHMLICEDDVELTRNIEEKFKRGIKEIGSAKWDVLYLGCGHYCGNSGLSEKMTSKYKYPSTLMQFISDMDLYVTHKNDLRVICGDDCEQFSEHISVPLSPGGTWCYAYSLQGAKKMLKFLEKDAGDHIDQLICKGIEKGIIKALAFDPPIVMHEEGAFRKDSDIPWEW